MRCMAFTSGIIIRDLSGLFSSRSLPGGSAHCVCVWPTNRPSGMPSPIYILWFMVAWRIVFAFAFIMRASMQVCECARVQMYVHGSRIWTEHSIHEADHNSLKNSNFQWPNVVWHCWRSGRERVMFLARIASDHRSSTRPHRSYQFWYSEPFKLNFWCVASCISIEATLCARTTHCCPLTNNLSYNCNAHCVSMAHNTKLANIRMEIHHSTSESKSQLTNCCLPNKIRWI